MNRSSSRGSLSQRSKAATNITDYITAQNAWYNRKQWPVLDKKINAYEMIAEQGSNFDSLKPNAVANFPQWYLNQLSNAI